MRSIRPSRLLPALFAAFTSSLFAAEPPINLWPADAPGEKGDIGEEKDMTKEKDNLIAGRPLIRLGNVSKPTLTVYKPAKEKDTGAAIIVCPGGGYGILALDLEGTEVCEYLNTIGVTGILLKYRVPGRKGQDRYLAPLQDAQRAVGVVRHHAKDWGIDPKRIGILGFSAGGHLAANASVPVETRAYPPVDDADKESCRPDFSVLIYPAYLIVKEKKPEAKKTDAPPAPAPETPPAVADEPKIPKISPELKIGPNTPPTFIAMTFDDGIGVENPIYYSLALKNAKVPVELHLYPKGGHGYGLRESKTTAAPTWNLRLGEWLAMQGWLAAKP